MILDEEADVEFVDGVFNEIGRFKGISGLGFYQICHFWSVTLGMWAGVFILYSMLYLELDPAYLCMNANSDTWYTCQKATVCSSSFDGQHKVDYSSDRTIYNWIMQYDLYCADEYFISLIGMLYFVGCFVGSIFLPRLADVYGRKPIFIVGLILYAITVVGALVSTNRYVLLGLMVLGGISESGRYYVGYIYAIEILPKRLASNGGLVIFTCFSTAKICICFHFWYASRGDWDFLGYCALAASLISLAITVFFLRESPRFLYDKGRRDQALAILQHIQRVNGHAKSFPITEEFKKLE